MASEMAIFRLFRVGHQGHLILVKATRAHFKDSIQPLEDEANRVVDEKFSQLLAPEAARLGVDRCEQLGSWEDASPQQDVFYEDATGIEIAIWFAFDLKYPGFFVFGAEETEAQFWDHLQERYDDGYVGELQGYSHPAQQARVLFVQEPPEWRTWSDR
jgi:hypothetical protein